jgi:hypothetical protein
MVNNPFEPPRTDTLPPAEIDIRSGAKAFGAWLLGASLVAGVSTALQTGYALSAFSAESRISGFLAVAAFRVLSAHVAAAAASVAIVVGMCPASSAGAKRRAPLWLFHAAVPLATPIAACTMILAGVGVGTLVYGLTARTSLESVLEIARASDVFHGVAWASAYALILGAMCAIVDPRRLPMRGRLAVRIIVAVLATGLVTALVRGALNAALS